MSFSSKILRKGLRGGLATVLVLCSAAAAPGQEGGDAPAGFYATPPPKVYSSPYYPCSQCHAAMPVNRGKRELTFHTEKKITGHGEPERWCLDCHNAEDRDTLLLITGEKVGFDSSHRLCGQCHGTIYKDWKAGIHGKRTGYWDGPKTYYLCTYCHDPHRPRFQGLEPMPAPTRPGDTLR